jgi:predicted XRE-type DNA-binding protein
MSDALTPSTGNVFEELGFAPEEAANLAVRSALMGRIREMIEQEGLTQARAARKFGVTQPRVSDLVRGRIELFSVDALINMLASGGHRVEVEVRPVEPRAA